MQANCRTLGAILLYRDNSLQDHIASHVIGLDELGATITLRGRFPLDQGAPALDLSNVFATRDHGQNKKMCPWPYLMPCSVASGGRIYNTFGQGGEQKGIKFRLGHAAANRCGTYAEKRNGAYTRACTVRVHIQYSCISLTPPPFFLNLTTRLANWRECGRIPSEVI